MNNLKINILILVFVFASTTFAESPFCKKNPFPGPTCAAETILANSGLQANLEPIETLYWLENEVYGQQDIYRQKKDTFAKMYRLLENGNLDDRMQESETQKEINDTASDFQLMFQMSKVSRILQLKLQVCYTGKCSASTRSDLETDFANVQKSKTLLLVKRPLLGHKVFENYIKSQKDDFVENDFSPADKTVTEMIKTASQETAGLLLEKVDTFERYLNDRKSPYSAEKSRHYITKYLNEVSTNYPEVIDAILDNYEFAPPPANKMDFLCSLANQRQNARANKAMVKQGIEISLFVAPLFLGPWSKLASFGLEGFMGARLLQWGLTANQIKYAGWAAQGLYGVGTSIYQSIEVEKIAEECSELQQKYFIHKSVENIDAFTTCKTNYQDAIFLSSLGWVATVTPYVPTSFNKYYKIFLAPKLVETKTSFSLIALHLRKTGLEKNQWAREFPTLEQGSFTYMDLSKIGRVIDENLKNIPDKYWKFVGGIYSDRLNLTPAEIKGFVQSSKELAGRTKLIVNTSKTIKEADNFNGGVGIVYSNKSSDLLPFEKATGVRVERKHGEKVAEIVRLTVSKEADVEKLSLALMRQAAGVILQDPTITHIYVYTSKIHARLYRKIGVRPESSTAHGERDVILKMTRKEIERLLANTKD